MVKQRMSTADVAGEVACLRRLIGMRVANVYDKDAKTYLLKMSRSGEEGEKTFLLLEAGVRLHTTETLVEKSDQPSNFALKLRKHLRAKRLDDVRQLGVDRLVDFSFGQGPACHHLLLELYAQGNVILTDADYNILTLLRSHRDEDQGYAIQANRPYPIRTVRPFTSTTLGGLQAALQGCDAKQTLKGAVAKALPFGPQTAEHCILGANLQPSRKPAAQPLDEGEVKLLMERISTWEAWLKGCETDVPKGYIFSKEPGRSGEEPGAEVVYDSYDALLLEQHKQGSIREYPTFDAALDDFYNKVVGQQAVRAKEAQERAAVQRLQRAKDDQANRVSALQQQAENAETKASLIEYNADAVEGAMNAVRSALAQGLSWKELGELIKAEKEAGNPVAGLVHSLQLDSNHITLLLANHLDTDEYEEAEPLKVDVDLDLNAYANARVHFDSRKAHASKQAKTEAAAEKALAAAEKKAAVQLSQAKKVAVPVAPRKPFWFERFHWFVTSENVLVVAGRDAQQNELLVKRHLSKGDLYVHADLRGAASTIVKNPQPDKPVPSLSLAQAGCMCVCRSAAWDAKTVTSAWWVHADQVSKSAPTGEYLTTGSFMVRGRKNYLPHAPLIMGFTVLFRLDESCLASHLGERAPREEQEPEAADVHSHAQSNSDAAASTAAEAGTGAPSALEAFLEGGADPVGLDRLRLGQEAGSSATAESSRTQHLSAAQRRNLKQQDSTAADGAAEQRTASISHEEATSSAGPGIAGPGNAGPGGTGSSSKAQALSRGKRSKARRAKDKYADQDEEDRELAMQLLASSGKHKDKRDKRKERTQQRSQGQAPEAGAQQLHRPPTAAELAAVNAHRKGAAAAAAATSGTATGTLSSAQPPARPAKPELAQPSTASDSGGDTAAEASDAAAPTASAAEGSASLQDQDGQDGIERGSTVPAAGAEQHQDDSSAASVASSEGEQSGREGPDEGLAQAEAASVADLLEEEGVHLVPEEERYKLTDLDSLTGVPLEEDVLLAAAPMCAPYTAMQSYKYRIKLTPGSQRKGKAARQAVELLTKVQGAHTREVELIRAVTEMDAINAMLGNVKMAMPGLHQVQNKARQAKKKK